MIYVLGKNSLYTVYYSMCREGEKGVRGKVSLFWRWTMKTILSEKDLPKLITKSEFDTLISRLTQEPIEKHPDVSVTYQTISKGVRVLAMGSLDECAEITGRILRNHPKLRRTRIQSRFIRVPASRFQCL